MSDDQPTQQQQPPPAWPPPGYPPGWPQQQPMVDPWAMVAMRSFPSGLPQLMAAGLPPSVILMIGLFMLYGELQTVTKNIDDIKETVTTLSTTVTTMSANVWTRNDQATYDAKLDARLRALEEKAAAR